MSYRFIYNNFECNRVIPAVLIDCRKTIPEIRQKTGAIIKSFTDSQAAMVTSSTIFYKIESEQGNLAGYVTLAVIRSGVVSILQYELRPAFQQFEEKISQELSSFISSSMWIYDYLQ